MWRITHPGRASRPHPQPKPPEPDTDRDGNGKQQEPGADAPEPDGKAYESIERVLDEIGTMAAHGA